MGKSVALLLVLVFLTASCLIVPLPVKAVSRTIVVPDDYPTIAAAIANATDGDTILVRSGTYNEQVLDTNKSISLIGEDAKSTIISLHPPIVTWSILDQTFSGYAAPIDINADNVIISGFTITSTGGNVVINGNNEWLTGNVLDVNVGLNGSYETVTNNTLNLPLSPILGIGIAGSYSKVCQNTGIGYIGAGPGSYNSIFANTLIGEIGDFGTGSSNLFYGNTVKDGIGMSGQISDIVADNTVTNCSHGISVTNGFDNIIVGNTITNNRGAGLTKIEGLGNNFYANYVAYNALGVQIGSYGTYPIQGNNTFYDNDFINNGLNNNSQIQVLVSSSTDYWNYGTQGNYWSDYNGTDANGDGIGDTPYYVGGTELDIYPLMSPFNISSINIQLPSWANLSLPNPLPTPSFPPSPSPSPSPIPSPGSSPSPSPTASLSPSPSPTTLSSQEPFPTVTVAVALVTIIAIVIGAGLLVYIKKREGVQKS